MATLNVTLTTTPTVYTYDSTQNHLTIVNNGLYDISFEVGVFANQTLHALQTWANYVDYDTLTIWANTTDVNVDITTLDLGTEPILENEIYNTIGTVKYQAGILSSPSYTYNLDGTLTIGDTKVQLFSTANYTGAVTEYDIVGSVLTLTENETCYVVADYNSGSPVVRVTLDVSEINLSDIIPIFTCSYIGNLASGFSLMNWGNSGVGTQNLLTVKDIKTNRFARESGLGMTMDASGHLITAPGVVWHGITRVTFAETTTETDECFLRTSNSADPTGWDRTAVTVHPNDSYDLYDGNGAQLLTDAYWGVIWVYKDMGTAARTHYVMGNVNSVDKQGAEASSAPSVLQDMMYNEAMLIGRIVFQKGSAHSTHELESSFTEMFTPSMVNAHDDLTGLKPTNNGNYYHSDQPINTTDDVSFKSMGQKLYNPLTEAMETAVMGTEYISPEQYGGMFGTVYRKFLAVPAAGLGVETLVPLGLTPTGVHSISGHVTQTGTGQFLPLPFPWIIAAECIGVLISGSNVKVTNGGSVSHDGGHIHIDYTK